MYRVLIAEDEILVRLGIKNSIDWDKMGLHIIADVDNGQDALRIFEAENPEIIITDIKMPIMDGMELIRRIRAVNKETKIVILSCLEDFELARNAITYGVFEYISKVSMSSEDIEKVMVKLLDEISANDSRHSRDDAKGSLPLVRENQRAIEKELKQLIFGSGAIPDAVSRLAALKSGLRESKLNIILFEAGNGDMCDDQVNLNILTDMVKSKLHPFFLGEVIADDRKRFLVVVNFLEIKTQENPDDRIREFAGDIQKLLEDYFGINVSAGISSSRDGFHNLGLLYSEAKDALKMKFCFGNGTISLWREDNGAVYQESLRQQLHAKQALLLREEFIQPHRISFYKSRLQQLMTQALDSDVAFLKMFFQMMYWHSVELSHAGLDISELLLEKQSRLIECETLEEFFGVFEEYIGNLNQLRMKNKYASKEMMDAINYMDENCHKNLTLQEVADHIGISPNYLSSLFKKQLNEGFVEHLTKQRIQKARDLLFETNLKLYEIAMETGFSDEAYFSRIFKKYTGKSPIYFRRQYRIHFTEADNDTI